MLCFDSTAVWNARGRNWEFRNQQGDKQKGAHEPHQKLFGGTSDEPGKKYFTFHAACNRCGEVIEGRVDLENDLSLNDEGDGYLVRKGLVGGKRCFQQIEVELKFDSARQIQEKSIAGGAFVE